MLLVALQPDTSHQGPKPVKRALAMKPWLTRSLIPQNLTFTLTLTLTSTLTLGEAGTCEEAMNADSSAWGGYISLFMLLAGFVPCLCFPWVYRAEDRLQVS